MAEALGNRLPSGYDEDFVNVVEDDFVCLICHLPQKKPALTSCGHRFCKECLEEHFRRQRVQGQPLNCPADRESLDRDRDVFLDRATERKILSLVIRCPSEDCDWTGELRNKEIHLESCLFKLVSCTNENCHVTIRRKDLEQHVAITCQWRIIKCEHCSELHPQCLMQAHIEQCSKFPVPCPNKCGRSTIAREMIPNHTENDCRLTNISCPYVQMGCETKVQRKYMESHLQSATRLHLDLACVKLNNTEVKLNNTEVKLNKTEETTRKLMEKLDTLERRFEEKVIKDQENVIEQKNVLDFTRMFYWKINNFSEILRRAEMEKTRYEIQSDPFYTSHYGYKLKLKLCPNFRLWYDKDNYYLSVFIVVMKGEYDALLPWPFKKKVNLRLIDQQEDVLKRKHFDKQLFAANQPEWFPRPVEEENKERGFPAFISHKGLHSRPYLVRDDTLFLQVEVGP